MNKKWLNGFLFAMVFSFFFLAGTKAEAAKWQWVAVGDKVQYVDMNSDEKIPLTSTFKKIKGHTYYFGADGFAHTGWLYHKKDTYFFRANGTMVINEWVGNYYFLKSGKMAKNKWVGGKNKGKYVGADGRLIPGYKNKAKFVTTGKGTRYRNSDGKFLKKSWVCVKNRWYYFYSNGYMAKNRRIGPYYVNRNGQMAVNKWVRIGNYRYHYGIDGKQDKRLKVNKK